MRQGFVNLAAKAGIPAPTGTQAIPGADAGFVPLYVVTVAYGQTAIVAADISVAPGAPFIQSLGEQLYLALTGGTLTGPLNGTVANFSTVTVNGINVQNASVLTSGLLAAALIPQTGVTQWQSVLALTMSQVSGNIPAGQVPVGAVTQWQANLSINWSQLAGAPPASILEALMLSGAVTLEADPGGTPANGAPGSIVAYY